MKLINIDDAEAEMKIALPVSIPFTDITLVEAGAIINESTVITLKSMGINEVTVYEESELREMLRQAENDSADAADKTPKVIIVDDEKEICDYISEILSSAGFKPITASGAADAWKKITSDASINDMFLDLMMPEMSGLEFLTKIRNELGRNINVIIITAKKTIDEVVIAKKLGVIDYIMKPFNPERILKPLASRIPAVKSDTVTKQNS